MMKQKAYENGWKASATKHLKARVGFSIRNLDKTLVHRTLGTQNPQSAALRKNGCEKLL